MFLSPPFGNELSQLTSELPSSSFPAIFRTHPKSQAMLSPPFPPPHIFSFNLAQTPSFFSVPPPKPINHSNSNSNSKTLSPKPHTRFRSSSTQIPTSSSSSSSSSSYPVHDLTSLENPDAESPSLSQSLRPYLLALWLRSCRSLKEVRRLHALVLRCIANSVTYVFNNLMCLYLVFGELGHARNVFDEMSVRNVVSWTAIINGYLKSGFHDEALGLFSEAVNEGIQPNGNMFVCALNLCCRRLDYELGRQVHAGVVKGGWSNVIVESAVVKLYAQCGELESAFGCLMRWRRWMWFV